MKHFWIVACICFLGAMLVGFVYVGFSYAESKRVINAFQELMEEKGTDFSNTEKEDFSGAGGEEISSIQKENSSDIGREEISNTEKENSSNAGRKEFSDIEKEVSSDIGEETSAVKEEISFETGQQNSYDKEKKTELVQKEIPQLVLSPSQEKENEEIRLLFSGDVYLSDTFLNAYDAGGVNGILDEKVLALMTKADVTMINQEFAFSDRGTAMEDKQYTFRVPPSRVKIFQEMGVDIVSLANNHALDFGITALEDSFSALDQAGILYAGAGKNIDRAKEMQTIAVNGKVIGFLAASRVIPVVEWNAGSTSTGMLTTYSPELLCRAIEENRAKCDYLVVFVHWGVEKNTYPEEYQFVMGKQYIDAGADAVIGCHPHVMQGIEYYQGKPIAHSLGNFIFNLRGTSTALLQIVIKGNGEVQVELIPVRTDALPFRLLTKEEKIEFYQYMESISFQISIDEDGIIRYNK